MMPFFSRQTPMRMLGFTFCIVSATNGDQVTLHDSKKTERTPGKHLSSTARLLQKEDARHTTQRSHDRSLSLWIPSSQSQQGLSSARKERAIGFFHPTRQKYIEYRTQQGDSTQSAIATTPALISATKDATVTHETLQDQRPSPNVLTASATPRHFSTFCPEDEVRWIDFSTAGDGSDLKGGDYVKYEWLSTHGMTVTATASDGGYTPDGKARIFDTSDPGANNGEGDPDLGSPNEKCPGGGPGVGDGGQPGEPGENCFPQGNVLIIQEQDKLRADDDSEGGNITFHFERAGTNVLAIGLMDIEEDRNDFIEIVRMDETSRDIMRFQGLGDNSNQDILIEEENVKTLTMSFVRSGAISWICVCFAPSPTAPVYASPAPVTTTPPLDPSPTPVDPTSSPTSSPSPGNTMPVKETPSPLAPSTFPVYPSQAPVEPTQGPVPPTKVPTVTEAPSVPTPIDPVPVPVATSPPLDPISSPVVSPVTLTNQPSLSTPIDPMPTPSELTPGPIPPTRVPTVTEAPSVPTPIDPVPVPVATSPPVNPTMSPVVPPSPFPVNTTPVPVSPTRVPTVTEAPSVASPRDPAPVPTPSPTADPTTRVPVAEDECRIETRTTCVVHSPNGDDLDCHDARVAARTTDECHHPDDEEEIILTYQFCNTGRNDLTLTMAVRHQVYLEGGDAPYTHEWDLLTSLDTLVAPDECARVIETDILLPCRAPIRWETTLQGVGSSDGSFSSCHHTSTYTILVEPPPTLAPEERSMSPTMTSQPSFIYSPPPRPDYTSFPSASPSANPTDDIHAIIGSPPLARTTHRTTPASDSNRRLRRRRRQSQ